MYAGVKDVRMLDGGFEAWKQFNGKISSCPAVPT
jgi:3-mercaptopyruvate sulfurtransferase SseA